MTSASTRWRAWLAALPLTLWTVFHLWEQWPAFAGREAWLARMDRTSRGPVAIAIEIGIAIVPLTLMAGVVLADLLRRRPLPGADWRAETGIARAVGAVAPVAAALTVAFVAIHVAYFWAPKVVLGAEPLETWAALRTDLGRPWMLAVHAVGVTALAWHLAATIPAALASVGWSTSRVRSAFVVSSVFAVCVWILAVQLVGWLATGQGTLWPIHVSFEPG